MTRFDRILWRINGFLILLGSAAIILMVLYATFMSFFFSGRAHHEAAIVATDTNKNKEYLLLGDGATLEGTSLVRMTLFSSYSVRGSLSSGSGGAARNYLFIHYPDLASWWLFPGFNREITTPKDLYIPRCGDNRKFVATIYEVFPEDSNHDGKIDRDDNATAYYAPAAKVDPFPLTPSSTRIISIDQVSDENALVIYQTPAATKALLLSVATGEKLQEKDLDIKREN